MGHRKTTPEDKRRFPYPWDDLKKKGDSFETPYSEYKRGNLHNYSKDRWFKVRLKKVNNSLVVTRDRDLTPEEIRERIKKRGRCRG